MGACRSKLSRQDQRLARAAEFVRLASRGDLAELQLMLKKGRVHVDAQDRFGMTALHWAAYAGKLVVVQELVKAGADASVVDTNQRNALHHACRKDHDDVARFLLEAARMDINAASESKDTPLHKAVRGKCVKTVVVLLKYGADPNLRNDQNRTPLEELDAAIGCVTDQVPTARTDAELTAWHQPPHQDEAETSSRGLFVAFRRRSFGRLGQGASASEKTLVRRFLSRRSSLSERSDDGGSQASITGMWAAHADVMHSRTASLGSASAVNPLNLAALHAGNARVAVAAQYSSSSMSSVSSVALEANPAGPTQEASHAVFRRKSLKYAGKRVIMALRVKKNLPGDEKRQMIRLLLEKYTTGEPLDAQRTSLGDGLSSPKSLTHQVSGFKLSLDM